MAERVGLLVAPLLAPPGPPRGGALSPLRCCRHRLIDAAKNLLNVWRRGWDSNPRTRLGVTHFPGVRLRPLGHLSINLRSNSTPGGIVRGCAANPPLRSGPTRSRRPKSPGRDLVEPTNTVRCYTLSRRAPSTARPPLHKPSLKLHTGWDCSRLRRESSASLRTDAFASSQIARARFGRTHEHG